MAFVATRQDGAKGGDDRGVGLFRRLRFRILKGDGKAASAAAPVG